jgi:hypothetical protein
MNMWPFISMCMLDMAELAWAAAGDESDGFAAPDISIPGMSDGFWVCWALFGGALCGCAAVSAANVPKQNIAAKTSGERNREVTGVSPHWLASSVIWCCYLI